MAKYIRLVLLISITCLALIPMGWSQQNNNFDPIEYTGVYTQIKEVNANHILVDTEQEAINIREQIMSGASFEEMAKKYSKCPSGANGGNLGYFRKGTMVPEFEKVAFSLKIGQISQPVKTQFGYHLIKVIDRK